MAISRDSKPFIISPEPDDIFDKEETTPNEPPKVKTGKATPLKGKLTTLYGGVGLAVWGFDQYCGQVILENAEVMAGSLDDLAKENASVKRVLEMLVMSGAWTAAIGAHLPIMYAIAVHHGNDSLREFLSRFAGAPVAETEAA